MVLSYGQEKLEFESYTKNLETVRSKGVTARLCQALEKGFLFLFNFGFFGYTMWIAINYHPTKLGELS